MIKVLFLTEYGQNVGIGHVNRCRALADAFAENKCSIKFLIRGNKSITNFPYDVEHIDWEIAELSIQQIEESDISIFDTYQIENSQLESLSSKSKLPVSITDAMQKYVENGIVVIGSIYGREIQIPDLKASNVLSGSPYILFRKEFWRLPEYLVKNEIENITISLGGFVEEQIIVSLLRIIQNVFPNVYVSVFGKVKKNEKNVTFEKVSFMNLFSSEDYIKQLFTTDLMITNGGQTLNESVLIGLPTIAISTADNQVKNALTWSKLGAIKYCGKITDENFGRKFKKELVKFMTVNERDKFSKVALQSIDSNGAKRAVDFILQKYRSL
ncbi:hypothetical protein [Pontibacter sp. BAB1700]|uniref:hypothetical protein n=1 Tax=Pontibacter sp. BAB1700 TaxID=1144253 RepID=UPI00026BC9BE|nr:hypothetical protein [Pontibacter sp. BAB1700]EJF09713.1 pseudaminic acid biosynthesis-associated protein PseG [Pontibacter sp. BAB1700]